MNAILATALLATAALANPVPNTNSTSLHPRQMGKGEDSGIKISIFSDKNCKGDGIKNQEMFYDREYAQQLLSYSLSDDIGDDDVLGFFADRNWSAEGSKGVDKSLDGDINTACATFAYHAEGNNLKKGCHTLPNVVGCVVLSINEVPSS